MVFNQFKKQTLLFLSLLIASHIVFASDIVPSKKVLYKVVDGDSLYLNVFEPEETVKPKAAIVFFFGGGWTSGSSKQFFQQAEYLASRGMLAISAEYRVKNTHGVEPFSCVEDAKSAIRWVRAHAEELNVDPNKIVASGGSAGGHIATCTAVIDGFECKTDDLSISSRPNAVVGYNPVFDTTDKGYGHKKVKGRETEISPCHQVKSELPPMLFFHGTDDKTVPFENAERFNRLMNEAGNDCELVAVDGMGHGFFNGGFFRPGTGDRYFNMSLYDTDVFLEKLGYLKGKPTIVRDLRLVSCVGDSNTEFGYATFLQEVLGDGYQVENFGKGGATIIEGSYFPYSKTEQYRPSLKFNPDVMFIMMGTNDANPKWCLDDDRVTAFEGTVQEEFIAGYRKLIQEYKKRHPKSEIYILTPLPVWAKKKTDNENLAGRQQQLNEWVIPAVLEIAEAEAVKVIDVHAIMNNSYKFTTDGVHFSDKGNIYLAKKIAKYLK